MYALILIVEKLLKKWWIFVAVSAVTKWLILLWKINKQFSPFLCINNILCKRKSMCTFDFLQLANKDTFLFVRNQNALKYEEAIICVMLFIFFIRWRRNYEIYINIFRAKKVAVFLFFYLLLFFKSWKLFNILLGLTTYSLVGLQMFGVIVFFWHSNTQRCHQVAELVL